jgi:NAD+ synthase
MQDWHKIGQEIIDWIKEYAVKNNILSLIVGVSGGIDSSVTSTLCAKTGLKTIVLNMPINQERKQNELANKHIKWLKENWGNVENYVVDLTNTYEEFISNQSKEYEFSELVLANTRSRLRMTTLYAIAGINKGIVVGTGNKVEDFGIGFFTKYGDGGVDISPIADLYKSEVYALAKSMSITEEIQQADPTDGLWDDGRTDEDQIGATYDELEWAMKEIEQRSDSKYSTRQKEVMEIYLKMNKNNAHKMKPIPIFKRKNIN